MDNEEKHEGFRLDVEGSIANMPPEMRKEHEADKQASGMLSFIFAMDDAEDRKKIREGRGEMAEKKGGESMNAEEAGRQVGAALNAAWIEVYGYKPTDSVFGGGNPGEALKGFYIKEGLKEVADALRTAIVISKGDSSAAMKELSFALFKFIEVATFSWKTACEHKKDELKSEGQAE